MTLRLTDDRCRIAEGLSDIVVRRLFAAGLTLEGALGLMGEHCAAQRIQLAVSELDRAIIDLRNVVFDVRRPGLQGAGESG